MLDYRSLALPGLSGSNSAVECDLAKVDVAGSNPVSRSKINQARVGLRAGSFLLMNLRRQQLSPAACPRPPGWFSATLAPENGRGQSEGSGRGRIRGRGRIHNRDRDRDRAHDPSTPVTGSPEPPVALIGIDDYPSPKSSPPNNATNGTTPYVPEQLNESWNGKKTPDPKARR